MGKGLPGDPEGNRRRARNLLAVVPLLSVLAPWADP